MKRRSFIRYTVAGICGALFLGVGWKIFIHRDKKRLVADLVRRRLGYLEIDDGDLEKFAGEFVERYGLVFEKEIEIASGAILPFGRIRRERDAFAYKVSLIFLQSSNLWKRPFEDMAKVRYLSLYDPYVAGCQNVFAEL
ncbi:MAG: hypothetical protein D6808_02300 [Candidatus Dadabacteria bacterium]|nr:MAG: hypothetical protein D6808_02300 [Candidatus Dadabacteria bacterium]